MVTVATSAGDIHPGAVVFATGMPPLLDGLAPGPPGRRIKGHLLVTEPSPVRLAGSLYPVATPLEDGRCWLAAPWTPATKARAFGRTSST